MTNSYMYNTKFPGCGPKKWFPIQQDEPLLDCSFQQFCEQSDVHVYMHMLLKFYPLLALLQYHSKDPVPPPRRLLLHQPVPLTE